MSPNSLLNKLLDYVPRARQGIDPRGFKLQGYKGFLKGRAAYIIDQTWQHVNEKGGPDRRFKNNRQLPICAYSHLNLSTPGGLDVRFLGSKEGGFEALEAALAAVRAAQR